MRGSGVAANRSGAAVPHEGTVGMTLAYAAPEMFRGNENAVASNPLADDPDHTRAIKAPSTSPLT